MDPKVRTVARDPLTDYEVQQPVRHVDHPAHRLAVQSRGHTVLRAGGGLRDVGVRSRRHPVSPSGAVPTRPSGGAAPPATSASAPAGTSTTPRSLPFTCTATDTVSSTSSSGSASG